VKLSLGDFFEWNEFVNAGVINQDIDFPEGFLRFSEQPLDFCLLRDVALDGDCFPPRLPISSTTLSAPSFEDA